MPCAPAGLPEADAATVAGAMLEADLTGSDAHGVFRLAGYVRQLKRGAMNPRPSIRVLERAPATALIDGDHGMGHVVMTHAAQLAVELARASGVGWVGARRSNHAGAGAIYAAIPLAHGMVGIYGAASSVNHMAPWGGTEPLLGTNPIAVAIPAGRRGAGDSRHRHLARLERRHQDPRAGGPADAARAGCRTARTALPSPIRAASTRALICRWAATRAAASRSSSACWRVRSTARRSAATSGISRCRPAASSMSGNS